MDSSKKTRIKISEVRKRLADMIQRADDRQVLKLYAYAHKLAQSKTAREGRLP